MYSLIKSISHHRLSGRSHYRSFRREANHSNYKYARETAYIKEILVSIKASSTSGFKCNAVVYRGKHQAVDSRLMWEQQSTKNCTKVGKPVTETACVIENKKRGKVRQEG